MLKDPVCGKRLNHNKAHIHPAADRNLENDEPVGYGLAGRLMQTER